MSTQLFSDRQGQFDLNAVHVVQVNDLQPALVLPGYTIGDEQADTDSRDEIDELQAT